MTRGVPYQLRSGASRREAAERTWRHLSLPYGCRHELRQLHPLVRRRRSLHLTSRSSLSSPFKPAFAQRYYSHPAALRRRSARRAPLPHHERSAVVRLVARRRDNPSPSYRHALARQPRQHEKRNRPVQPLDEDAARGARSRTYLRCGLAAEAAVRSVRTLSRVRRTPGISCEAVPASDRAGAGMRRHVHPGNHAAESFVSFIPLFDGALLQALVVGRLGTNVAANTASA